jgi:hypothetical protein
MISTSVPNEDRPFYYLMTWRSVTTAVGSMVNRVLVIEAPAHRVSLGDLIAAARSACVSQRLNFVGRGRFI